MIDIEKERYEIRQQIDILESKLNTIEHRAEIKVCPECGHENKGEFPEGVDKTMQYGNKIKALTVYLSQYQLITYERIKETINDVYDHELSVGTLVNFNKKSYSKLEPIEDNIKKELLNSGVVHFDETGLKVESNSYWIHVASNEEYTYYTSHQKRGKEAVDSNYSNNIFYLEEEMLKKYSDEYDRLIADGKAEDYQINHKEYSKRKNAKKSTSLNLLNRLTLKKDLVLSFMYDFNIPFDNNQAERDVRMVKVKQKISGTFRSTAGADCFARISGYISTIKKKGLGVLSCLETIFTSDPYDPTTSQS